MICESTDIRPFLTIQNLLKPQTNDSDKGRPHITREAKLYQNSSNVSLSLDLQFKCESLGMMSPVLQKIKQIFSHVDVECTFIEKRCSTISLLSAVAHAES